VGDGQEEGEGERKINKGLDAAGKNKERDKWTKSPIVSSSPSEGRAEFQSRRVVKLMNK